MKSENQDSDLQKLFQEIRETDETLATPFRQTWKKAQLRQRPKRFMPLLRPALAAGVVFLFVIAVYLLKRPDEGVHNLDLQTVSSLSAWQSPTNFLLKTPGMEVIHTVPDLGTSTVPNLVAEEGVKR